MFCPNDPYFNNFTYFIYNLLQLYDRISSKVVSPTRAPPSDAVQKCRDALDAIRDFEQTTSPADLELELSGEIEELRELLSRAHFKVRHYVWHFKITKKKNYSN